MASTLVAIEYDDPYKAEEMRLKLIKMQKEYLIDLEDAVVAVKDDEGEDQAAPVDQPDGPRRHERGLLGRPGRPPLPEPTPGHGDGGGRRSGLGGPHRPGHQ